MTTITAAIEVTEEKDSDYRRWLFCGFHDSRPFSVYVEDGQYEYEDYPEDCEDDEPIQIAIGEYAETHNLDLGKCHR